MASGLGQKYGAPRRNAQEKLRTEVSRSDTWGMEIQGSLELLRDLCAPREGRCQPQLFAIRPRAEATDRGIEG